MSKEKLALNRIREIVKEPMEAWEEFQKNPHDNNARDAWIQASLSSDDLIEIFCLLKRN